MKAPVKALVLFLAACGGSTEAQHRWHCGEAFAIDLRSGESIETSSPVEDFVLHRLGTPNGLIVIYEGNAPQQSDDVIETGMGWPQLIAIHDNRSPRGEAIRPRLVVGAEKASICPVGRDAGRQK